MTQSKHSPATPSTTAPPNAGPSIAGTNQQRITAWGQEMRAVHQRLRDALDIARESIERGEQPNALVSNDLQLFCGGFCAALGGHHTSEDATLFPVVLRDQPDLAGTVGKLKQDHSVIAHLIRGLEQAVRTNGEKASLLRHLDGIEAVMETHFGFEERQLVVILDAMNVDGLDKVALYGPIAEGPSQNSTKLVGLVAPAKPGRNPIPLERVCGLLADTP